VTPRTLTRRQLNRAILERQGLLRREAVEPIEMVERLVGMQAQVPTDPYVGLWARIEGFRPEALSGAIAERAAVRAVMLMRTTIHLVSARDCLAMRPLLQGVAERQWGYSPFARRLAGLDLKEVLDAGRELLAEKPRTANQIGRLLAERWPGGDAESLGYGVRALVPVVQIPPRGLWGRGGQPVLETVERWLGAPLDPKPSIDALVLRYLAAFGPATAKDAQTWSWLSGLREVLDRLRPQLRVFRDESGRELFDLPDAPLPDPETPAPVRLLPEYDNLLLSHDDRSRIGDPALRGRPWMRGSVLVDGFLHGTWRSDRKAGTTTLSIGLYHELTDGDRMAVEEEADDLLGMLATTGERQIAFVDLDAA
jgi:Winged helix DNA-binding domain